MAQQKPEERVTLVQVMGLVDQLTPEEKGELRRKLDESWGEQWDQLASRIRERCKDMPPLTDEEIMAEVKAVREERKARRAQGGR